MGHATLSPSAASRWLVCTPSARLEQQFPDKAGQAAAEGTLAHAIAEDLLRFKLGEINELQWKDRLRKHQQAKYRPAPPDGMRLKTKVVELYQPEMLGYVEEYTSNIIEKYTGAGSGAVIFLETKLDLTEWVPEGFGTGDVIILADEVLYIDDLKYGKGVPVDAEQNRQMMLYALGAVFLYHLLYSFKKVVMTIHQPRLDSVSSWEIPLYDLLSWAETELKPKAQAAFDGSGHYVPGKHCRFCKAAGMCKANADYNLQIAEHDFKNADLLTDAEVTDILRRADLFTKWLKNVTEHALAEAVKGKKWPDMKLVEGRSVRIITDVEAARLKLVEAGYKPTDIMSEPKLLGITALTGNLGAANFNKLVGPYLKKPQGKPTLAVLTDKRPELSSIESAEVDFADSDDTE